MKNKFYEATVTIIIEAENGAQASRILGEKSIALMGDGIKLFSLQKTVEAEGFDLLQILGVE